MTDYQPPETIDPKDLDRFGQSDRSSIHWWSPDGTIQHLFIEGHVQREADRREIIRRVSTRCPLGDLLDWYDPPDVPLLDPDQIVLYVKMTGFEQHPGPEALAMMRDELTADLGWN